MNRHEKEALIQSFRKDCQGSNALFLVDIQGLTVNQLQELRRKLHAQGGKMRVAKNTLARRVMRDEKEMKELESYLKNQVAFIFAHNESPQVAKVVWDSARANDKIKLVAGFFESNIINVETIKLLALLPSRPMLLAQVCRVLSAPLVRHVSCLQKMSDRLVPVVEQVSAATAED